ncbi:T9SS type A sorting domain-containing protein [Algibacter amylolyticus]|uniref:T9SS type A sorting domain-containing protein n=1 Tax=Algibacter amylolyticus TaxID=1608400 RepID=A0A5M7B8P2_9FLAO|nr:T9SS type A sorting domain-containing protein [Algibacter amylolyticus]KAA5823705.1 T9SS type A sorting domain-containing protein [Algibacter amylolyticus]MBB5267875.1 hypothetical protein [Algibacter amylolyticus]TSJ74193.1 T9SS type A sorting domain-containing protein [Algibacter amylolyticus]
MKKITLLFLLLSGTFAFAQQIVSLVSINGQTVTEFKTETNATLNVASSYDFVIDYSGQDVSNPNEVIVKILAGGSFADTPNFASAPITTASGQVTVTLTPTTIVDPAILQIRTTSSTNFGNSGDNIFDYSWKVAAALSTEDFAKEVFTFYPNPAKTEINIKTNMHFESFQVIDVTGKVIKKGDFNKVINIEKLQKGIYFLGLDSIYQKFIKD